MVDVRVNTATVAIDELKPHPDNARRGNVDVIADSLARHGQYRPIVAQTSTRRILAGNHTWAAAKRLGWDKIAVTWLDCDDETARRVLIADNKASDLATYDNDALVKLLKSLPTLDGTGFDIYDLQKLEGLFDVTNPTEGGSLKEPAARPDIALGTYQMWLNPDALAQLTASVPAEPKRDAVRHLRLILGFPPAEPAKKAAKSPMNITAAASADLIPVDSIQPFDGNAREGDIGAISESLRHLGQYRPIVVNRRTMRILVGNHTWQAARSLGWPEIAVAWVDVDDDTAARIVLIDNRSADLATYDDDALLALLTSTPLAGTGFDGDDIDTLLSDVADGRSHRNPAKTSDISCRVASWGWKVNRADFDAWDAYDDQYAFIVGRLNLPLDSWTSEAPT